MPIRIVTDSACDLPDEVVAKYGIEVAPVAGLTPDAEPTPAGIARLQQLIDEEGITTVFSERLARLLTFQDVQRVATLALIVIIFDGGMGIGTRRLRSAAVPIAV